MHRLREAGAVVLGRTRTHEFAWGLTTWHPDLGGAHNPHDLTRVTGGSSGGSAAAVAAGVVPLALGTDTGCSLRLPAAWCGVVGHKPTHGAVPTAGVLPLAPSLDVVGAITRDAADARLALEVLTGRQLPPQEEVMTLRVGLVDAGSTAPEVRAAVSSAARRWSRVQDVALPFADSYESLYATVMGAEALAGHRAAGHWPGQADLYGADVRSRLERCERLTGTELADAEQRRTSLRKAVRELFLQVDLLLLPVASCGPSTVADPDHRPGGAGPLRGAVLPWTVLANLCGLPACAVPAGVDEQGMPVAVQVVGPPGADGRVLDAACALAGPALE